MRRCIICDHVVDDETTNLTECPKCGTKSIPCDPAQDVMVKINWHELRILSIWAEFWANQNEATSSPGTSMQQCIFSITARLQAQHPSMPPLTLGGELRDLKKTFKVETNIPHEELFDPTTQGPEQ